MSHVIRFENMVEAFEFLSFGAPGEHEAYLCRRTGIVHYHSEYGDNEDPLPDDIDDNEKYIALPHKNELSLGKRLVLCFTAEVLPEEERKVQEIFSRRGAYARFKDLLERSGKLQEWYDYEAKAQKEALRAWCKDNGIEIDG